MSRPARHGHDAAVKNVANILRDNAGRDPNGIALRAGGRVLTFGELDREVRSTASHLRSIGIRCGNRVGLSFRDGIDTFVLIFALARIGSLFLVIDRYSRPGEITRLVEGLRLCTLIVGDGSAAPAAGQVLRLDRSWKDSIGKCRADEIEPVNSCNEFVINTSSGTTGKPKGLVLTHAQYCQRWRSTHGAVGWGRGGSHLCLGLLGFSGARNSCLFQLLSGNSVTLGPYLYLLDELVGWIREYGITSAFVSPVMINRLLTDVPPAKECLLPELDCLWLTGGETAGHSKSLIRSYLCPNIYDEYGASGFGTISCLVPRDLDTRPGSVGRPVAGVRVEIVDDAYRVLPRGRAGRIRCRGPNMSAGFENDSGDQAYEFFRDGWFYPGDMGYLDKEGFLFLRGRATDMIIRGGVNIYPEEIERVLHQHAAVREAVVVGRSEPDLGEHVEAFVSLNSPCSQTALIKFCRQRLSSHKVPDAIHILDELPRTAAGKISRKALVEPPGAFLTDTR